MQIIFFLPMFSHNFLRLARTLLSRESRPPSIPADFFKLGKNGMFLLTSCQVQSFAPNGFNYNDLAYLCCQRGPQQKYKKKY